MDRPHLRYSFISSQVLGFVVSDPAMDFFLGGMSSHNLLSCGHILESGLVAVLTSFVNLTKLGSSRKRECQLRNCLYQIGLWTSLWGIPLVNDRYRGAIALFMVQPLGRTSHRAPFLHGLCFRSGLGLAQCQLYGKQTLSSHVAFDLKIFHSIGHLIRPVGSCGGLGSS